jgi:hypothetical protein
VRRGWACALLVAVAACSGGSNEPDSAVGTTSTTAPGPKEILDLQVGDCLAGLAIGVAERRQIDGALTVSCDGPHDVELFAAFAMAEGPYPGVEPVVRAADEGCADALDGRSEDPLGLLALWPTVESWTAGDRTVSCGVFDPAGVAFPGRVLVTVP